MPEIERTDLPADLDRLADRAIRPGVLITAYEGDRLRLAAAELRRCYEVLKERGIPDRREG
jgi:hypothetical protein